jgi:UDP-GlcNAc:undecaprenyl-phosphate GlcNAc-1-phosphate transferase
MDLSSIAPVIFLTAFAVSLLMTPFVRRLAFAVGVIDRPNPRKVHAQPTAMLGGVAVLCGFMAGVGVAWHHGVVNPFVYGPARGIALGAALVCLLGLVDDKFGVSPLWKLMGQALAAIFLIFFEIKLSIFIRENLITTIVTVVWIVGITNAFNLLDNMNGLSSGVGLIAALTFGWVAYEQNDILVFGLALALAGAAAGFLPWNFPRAKIFLGDAGSLLIGFTLAAISVQGIYLASSKLSHLPIITPILILGVPLFDTLSVILIRLARGLPVFQADKNHFSHRLVDLGLTQKQAVLLIFLVAIAVSIPATLLSHVVRHEAVMLILQEIILFVIIVALMRAGMVRGDEREKGIAPPGHEDDQER